MRRGFGLCCAVSCLAVSASVVPAAELGVGLRAGTQGLGAEFGVGLSERFTLRAGYYAYDYDDDYEETDIVFDGELTIGGAGLLVDLHPFKNGFRLSAGVFSNDNEVDLTATPTAPQEIGNNTYTPAEIGTLTGHVGFDGTAPYFGIGYGRLSRGRRVGFLFDAGILRQGSGDVRLTSSAGMVAQEDLDAEIGEVERDIEDFDLWPVLSFGLAIRF